MSEEFGRKTCS